MRTGQFSTPTGNRVGGATSTTSAPRVDNRSTLERTTRECRQSPQMTTFLPATSPMRERMVTASSRAWVGCWWRPSPALITLGPLPPGATTSARCWGAPESGWRMMIASAPSAFSVRPVSRRDSPFFTEEVEAAMFIMLADSALPAASKEERVRVEFS